MSYSIGEEAALNLVMGVEGFDAKNTVRGKWNVLNQGFSDHYAILKRGESSSVWDTLRNSQDNYRTIVEVWQRYTDDGISYEALLEHHENIKTRVKGYRLLGDDSGTVFDANYTGSSVVTEQWRNNNDGPSWLKIDLYIDWSEQNVITLSE